MFVFVIYNFDNAVVSHNEDKEVVVFFDSVLNQENISLIEIIEADLGRSRIKSYDEFLINERDAIVIEDKILVNYEENKYHHNVYLIKWNNDRIWRFSILTIPNLLNKYKEETLNIVKSFDSLTNYDKKIAQPLRIEIIKVLDTDTIDSLSEKMAVLKNKKELFCVMNGLDCNSENTLITSGALIKMISY